MHPIHPYIKYLSRLNKYSVGLNSLFQRDKISEIPEQDIGPAGSSPAGPMHGDSGPHDAPLSKNSTVGPPPPYSEPSNP